MYPFEEDLFLYKSKPHSGLLLDIDLINVLCFFVLTSDCPVYNNGTTITSPNHPGNYGNSALCGNLITVSSGTIAVYIDVLNIEYCGPQCGCDGIRVKFCHYLGHFKDNGKKYDILEIEGKSIYKL